MTSTTTASPLDFARELLGPGLRQIAGTSLSGEIPMAEGLLNRLIALQLAASNAPVASLEIEAHDADTLTAHVSLRSPSFVPTLRVVARIDQQPDFPAAPVLGVRWTVPGLSLLARLAAPALSLFSALPPGIVVDGDRLLVNIRQLLESQGAGDLGRHLRALRVTTREGVVVVAFEVRVEEGSTA